MSLAASNPTLTNEEILLDVIREFATTHPLLMRFGRNFTNKQIKKGQTVIAHILREPTVEDYDAANGGYANGSSEARNMMEDVLVTIDNHKHSPINIKHLRAIADKKQDYMDGIRLCAQRLAGYVFDDTIAKFVAANVSHSVTAPVASFDKDALIQANMQMNIQKAGRERYMLTSSEAYAELQGDPRITSNDYYAQRTEGDVYGHLVNIAGFRDVYEYPAFSEIAALSGTNAIAFDPRAVTLYTGLPDHTFDVAQSLGIPDCHVHATVTDPDTGLTMMLIGWVTPGVVDVNLSVTMLWGSAVGKNGGADDSKTDRAALLLTEA